MSPKAWLTIAFFISSAMTVSFYLTPFFSPSGSFIDLDGTPGVMDHWDIWSGKDPFTMILYSIGDMVCHQQMSRTLILNGSEMPICIRDLGLLAGFSLGSAACIPMMERLHSRKILVIAIVLMSVTVFEWMAETASVDLPAARLATAMVSGAGAALLLSWMLNRNMKRNEQAFA